MDTRCFAIWSWFVRDSRLSQSAIHYRHFFLNAGYRSCTSVFFVGNYISQPLVVEMVKMKATEFGSWKEASWFLKFMEM